MAKSSILVTGGAGYIGSHVVQQLTAAGEKVVVLDNLVKGFRQAVPDGTPLVVGDVGDTALVGRLIAQHAVGTVMHFAAHTVVPESVANPLKYYGNNACGTRNLVQACVDRGVREFVFSSTAAVYGIPAGGYADEDTPTAPINAYGTSKLVSEWMLRDVAATGALRYAALRYFNVAGSDPAARIGQATPGATLLTKVACEAIVGKRSGVAIYGTDYATPDGTGVRDYIHAVDLRRGSPSFGRSWGVELSEQNRRMRWVPPGLAHGILITSASADFLYKCTDVYSPAHERTLMWNDPALGIAWPLPAGVAPQLSAKDAQGKPFAAIETFP